MAKYVKKPIVIEAEQWFPWSNVDGVVPGFVSGCLNIRDDGVGCPDIAHIHTLEGPLQVSESDWIITGIKGEKYPCKPDIFEATYTPVEEGEETE